MTVETDKAREVAVKILALGLGVVEGEFGAALVLAAAKFLLAAAHSPADADQGVAVFNNALKNTVAALSAQYRAASISKGNKRDPAGYGVSGGANHSRVALCLRGRKGPRK
jgi:hypothetical protein